MEGSVILLPANGEAELIANHQNPVHAYKIAINTQEQNSSLPEEAMIRKSGITTNTNVHFFLHESEIVAYAEQLYRHRMPDREIRHVQNQILFHQILLRLLEKMDVMSATGEQPSMERSITYLENNISEKITRELLAAIAGVSRSHYSTLFKQLTGFSPNSLHARYNCAAIY
jgi:AraC-like DNA-binding protein